MISIVTGTLNRRILLPNLIANTVDANVCLELVLVDGGSTDGTLEYLDSLSHPRIKVVRVGQRSSYPHFMNLGIRTASHELICQWNDDVLLQTSWSDVLEAVKENEVDAWIFSWQYVPLDKVNDKSYCDSLKWNLYNQKPTNPHGEIVMNYGVYRKELFRKFGMFDPQFHFYYADGELSHRFYTRGAKFKDCADIRVASIEGVGKTTGPAPMHHLDYYNMCKKNHMNNVYQSHLEFCD